ncbi:MAG: AraC family transcriptional regulator [Kofleriaceae bacterium]|nr:AraC family transcriptional regulator [Kofleriaceae bacterium]
MVIQLPGIGLGVLHPKKGVGKYDVQRYSVCESLASMVDFFWTVSWDISEPFEQEVVPGPNLNLVCEAEQVELVGVVSGVFTRRLEGAGRVLSAKFTPAGARAFYGGEMSRFTDKRTPQPGAIAAQLQRCSSVRDKFELFEQHLLDQSPVLSSEGIQVNSWIRKIETNKNIRKISDITEEVESRTLQRLFQRHVGISPKWTILRYRLQECCAAILHHPIAEVAATYGFSDQSHFTTTFRKLIGMAPAAYIRTNRP